MRVVVLAEHQVHEAIVVVHHGREFSLLSQMMSLATLRLVSAGATIIFSRGVMKSATFASMDIRDKR